MSVDTKKLWTVCIKYIDLLNNRELAKLRYVDDLYYQNICPCGVHDIYDICCLETPKVIDVDYKYRQPMCLYLTVEDMFNFLKIYK
jgi:hypothetical protein